MRKHLRLAFAILASTASVLPMYFVWAAIVGDLDNDLLLPVAYFALTISAIGVVVVGLPTHFILRYIRKQKSYCYALPGFLAAALLSLFTGRFGAGGWPDVAVQALQLGLFGMVVALVFWRIAVPKTAD